MAAVDPAFRTLPKNATFFIIWRIEKMQVVPVPKEHYGNFFTGDSYIIACATEPREKGCSTMKSKEAKFPLEIHIHFWLGTTTSQDETGVAAYKTVELDDFLGGSPVQHREVQGYESKRFLSYFKKGIRLLEGGVASGFNHVTNYTEPRMFQIKGKRKPVVRQMPSVSWSHMNDGDVFVIDTDKAVFVWTGRSANNMEKIQGARVAQGLKNEHKDCTLIIVEDQQENKLPPSEKQYFDKLLPLKEKSVKSQKEVTPDDVLERRQTTEMKLYRCSDESGTLKVTEVKSGPVDQRDLNSQDSFIIDNGEAGIWVWVGKRATAKERTEAMRNAQGFIKKKGYPNHTQVTRVIDCGEPPEFKSLFRTWTDNNQTVGLGRSYSIGKIAKTIQTKFDASTLHENPHLAAETQMVDDGTGSKEVFRVMNFDLVAIDDKDHGKFYSGDCYIVIYAYSQGNKEFFMIYYWLGRHSTVDEQGTAAMKTVELDDKLNGKAVQIRVVQGKEPPHFMAIFGGRMVIFEGGCKSGFKNSNETTTNGVGESYLLQVRGTSEYNTKAFQVDLTAGSLNSNDVFILYTHSTAYVWAGKGSTGDEREMAKRLASQSGREMVMVYEGQEKDDFWTAIGGKGPYQNDKRLQDQNSSHHVRLFQCSNASGRFLVEEIVDFDQSDLIEDDVMLLDAWDTLFLWIGSKSNNEERTLAISMAEEYLKTDPSGRDANRPIVKIKQGYEPPNFTGFFGVWEHDHWKNSKTYDQFRTEFAENNPGISLHVPIMNGQNNHHIEVDKYPLKVLLSKHPDDLPEGIDITRKEIYLSDEDFHLATGMSPDEYQKLPKWRQLEVKKKAGLF